MCGICGVKGNSSPDVIQRMTSAMVHRGPDSDGFFFDRLCSLGMRRLKIIDVLGSEQPIFNEDKSIILVCNGEIYNYKELRNSLQDKGHRFTTNGDIEVIVHLYEDRSQDCVLALRGMYAFAIWDSRQKQLLLARDRLGIKPLYYSKLPGKLLFASEIKSLLASGETSKELDEESIVRYTTYPAIPAPLTIFRQIQAIPPGHTLLADASGIDLREYWDVDFSKASQNQISDDEVIFQVRQALEDSVRMRMMSEVPIGAFLSGGIDSSAVVGLMSALTDHPVRTFSIRFAGKDASFEWFDDASYAAIIARHFQTRHTEAIITGKEVLDNLLDAVWSTDQPSGDALQYYLVSKSAAAEVTVALSGTGGDEVFAGYEWFKEIQRQCDIHSRLRFILPKFAPAGLWIIKKLRKNHTLPAMLHKMETLFMGCNSFENIYKNNRRMYRGEDFFYIFSPEFISKIVDMPLDMDINIHKFALRCAGLDPVAQTSYLQIKTDLPALLLRDQDAVSMAHSLEVRFPLIDHKLIELMSRVPSDWKLHRNVEKYVLRKALADILPEEIANRTKKGFIFPMDQWMQTELKPVVESCLSVESVRKRGIFNAEVTEHMKKSFFSGKIPFFKVWNQVMFELWCRIVLDRDDGFSRPTGNIRDFL